MKMHVHIERLVVDAGLDINGPELEAEVADALQAMLRTSGSSSAWIGSLPSTVAHLKAQWPSGRPVAPAIGTAISDLIQGSVMHGGTHDQP